MNISTPEKDDRIEDVTFAETTISFFLRDGRIVTAPLSWYPQLFTANDNQRRHWRLCGAGYAVHWPYFDEDIGIAGVLAGVAAPNGFVVQE